jgi:hypothetical protein
MLRLVLFRRAIAARKRWSVALLHVAALGCNTGAVGVEACRKVEAARCKAAEQCGLLDDVEGCIRFSEDHCLHGMDLDDEPGQVQVGFCVDAVEAAGNCAEDKTRRTDPEDCDDRGQLLAAADATEVCDIVQEPERAKPCAFLSGSDPEPEPEPEPEPDDRDAG